MTWKKKTQPPCQSCGDEGAEFCWLCHFFLCDECLGIDYNKHREEAEKWSGRL